MTDALVQIEAEHWPALRDLYSSACPETYRSYNLLDFYCRWFANAPDTIDVVFYSLNGEWSDDGIFLAVWKSPDAKKRDSVYLSCAKNDFDRMLRLLQVVDFSKGFEFESIMDNEYAAVQHAIQLKHLKSDYQISRRWYLLPRADALKLEIVLPDGISLKQVPASDVHIVDEKWTGRCPGSLQMFEATTTYNPSVGAYTSDGRLIGYAFRYSFGDIGALRTNEEFLRRGIGMAITKALSLQIAQTGVDVSAYIRETNALSQALFEKIGFTLRCYVHWINTLPTDTEENSK